MTKKFIAVSCLILISTFSIAQDKLQKEYKERSTIVKEEIFGTPDANFNSNNVPAQYKEESAIILAKKVHYTMDKKNRIRLTLFGPASNKRLSYFTTIRYKVKLNDKAALEEFSSIEYQKIFNQNTSLGLFSTRKDNAFTFVGIKVIKPNGTVNEVSTDEEILTKDEKKQKEGKLAIPNLEVGDIIDYYIRVEEVQDITEKVMGPYVFLMGGDYPILNLDLKFVIDKAAGIAYRSNNGAPKFKQARNEDDDYEFSLMLKDLPKIKSQMWQYPLRQFPYIMLSYNTTGGYSKPYKKDEITQAITQDEYLDLFTRDMNMFTGSFINDIKDDLKRQFGKDFKEVDTDSLAHFVLNLWQHQKGYKWSEGNENLKVDCSINDYNLYNFRNLLFMHFKLQELNIDNEIVVTNPINGPKSGDILYYGDYDFIIRTKGKNPIYFNWDNRFMKAHELPIRFQGQEGVALDVDSKKSFFYGKLNTYNRNKVKLPTSTAEDNKTIQKIEVSFAKDNLTKLSIDRTVAVRGHYRPNYQMQLALPEETQKINAQYLGLKDIVADYSENKKTRKLAEDYVAAFSAAKSKWKDNFKDEFNEDFGVEAKEVTNYKIENYALRHWEKDFIFSATYAVEDWVKKAGNNYIFEVGKLMGTFKKVDEKERTRTHDIYMPCARTFEFTFTINVPQGYSAKGIEALNKNIINDAASFISTASLSNNVITVNVKRIYKNAYEPLANWNKLLQAMDVAYDFTNSKILFEKAK